MTHDTDFQHPLITLSDQVNDALVRIDTDPLRYLPWPWETVNAIAGPIAPGELYFVAARPGVGKTTFLLDWFDRTTCDDPGRSILYIGLEQPPKELRTKWACLRHAIPPKLLLKPSVVEISGQQYQDAYRCVSEDLKDQQFDALRRTNAHFANTRRITAGKLIECVQWAVDECDVVGVVVDHIDRMDHGDGVNSYQDMVNTVVACKQIAQRYSVGMLVASQLRRAQGDHITAKYQAPTLDDLRGGGIKGEEADVVLGLYRPLKNDITDNEIKSARLGIKSEALLLEPNTTAVRVLKNRLDGAQTGAQSMLTFRAGRFYDPPLRTDRDRYDV